MNPARLNQRQNLTPDKQLRTACVRHLQDGAGFSLSGKSVPDRFIVPVTSDCVQISAILKLLKADAKNFVQGMSSSTRPTLKFLP